MCRYVLSSEVKSCQAKRICFSPYVLLMCLRKTAMTCLASLVVVLSSQLITWNGRGYCHELASQVLGAGRQGGKQLDDSDPTRGVIIALHRPQGPGPRIHNMCAVPFDRRVAQGIQSNGPVSEGSGRLSWCYGHSIEMLIKSNIRPARSLCCVATRQRLPMWVCSLRWCGQPF